MNPQHSCLKAKRAQLVRELNQVLDEQLAYAKSMGFGFYTMAQEDDHFMFLVDKECQIQNQLDHIDTTIE